MHAESISKTVLVSNHGRSWIFESLLWWLLWSAVFRGQSSAFPKVASSRLLRNSQGCTKDFQQRSFLSRARKLGKNTKDLVCFLPEKPSLWLYLNDGLHRGTTHLGTHRRGSVLGVHNHSWELFAFGLHGRPIWSSHRSESVWTHRKL